MDSQPTGIDCPAYGRRLPIGWDFCMPAFVDFHPKHRLFKKKMSVLDSYYLPKYMVDPKICFCCEQKESDLPGLGVLQGE